MYNKQILILKEKAIPRIKFSIRSICFWKMFIHGGIFWGNRLHDFAPEKKCWLAWTEIVIESRAFLFRSRKLLISLFCNNLNGSLPLPKWDFKTGKINLNIQELWSWFGFSPGSSFVRVPPQQVSPYCDIN